MSEFPVNRSARQSQAEADRFTYLYSATVLSLAGLLLFYVAQYMEMVEVQIDISRNEKQIRELEEGIERMRVKKAQLARLERLEFAAQERLGLILPSQSNVRYLHVTDVGRGDEGETLVLQRAEGDG